MKLSYALTALFVAFGVGSLAGAQTAAAPRHSFTVVGDHFALDGQPYQIRSGEMHYARVPRAYWRQRFRMARAMGLNTITTYVFWNEHEPQPGVFDFSGQNDLAEYLREAQQEGLHVILRPGPYVCAEWELGGYPSWLLKNKQLVLRSRDADYTAAVHRWFQRLGQVVHPLMLSQGGPIIAVQLENEYGSFGDDKQYLEGLKQELIADGMGDGLIYTADGADEVPKGSLPELPAVINFGSGDAKSSFAKFATIRPTGPRMSGEYWAGWFDHWGEKHHVTDGAKEAEELRWMLSQGYSVSIYMFHGGTSFGWMNGANSNGTNYQPDTTSYDYDAPLNEAGQPTAKYDAFRKVIAETTHEALPPVPSAPVLRVLPVESQRLSASLWQNLPAPVHSATLLSFEDLNQAYGYVLYRTSLRAGQGGALVMHGLHDYAQVYLDQKLIGTADRRLGTDTVQLPVLDHAATLDILVENSGRVNYTKVIRGERKGITGDATLAGTALAGWEIYSLPMNDLARLHFAATPCEGPCFYRQTLDAATPADTYVDTAALHKGALWVGDRALGRFWSIGPQFALYLPGAWLQAGANTLTWFDLMGAGDERVHTVAAPIFDQTLSTRN
jgi:beta-galactosidase